MKNRTMQAQVIIQTMNDRANKAAHAAKTLVTAAWGITGDLTDAKQAAEDETATIRQSVVVVEQMCKSVAEEAIRDVLWAVFPHDPISPVENARYMAEARPAAAALAKKYGKEFVQKVFGGLTGISTEDLARLDWPFIASADAR